MSESQKMQKALAEFRNPYSCSQTVYAAYAANPDAEELNNLKAMSGGRAPGNLCGALYAAKQLLPEKLSGEVERLFASATGSTKCAEIKRVHKTPCHACVKAACEIVEKFSSE